MTETTSEIELEMERQEADAEQDLLDRMADAFGRAEPGFEVEAIWAVRDEYLEQLRAERDDMAQGATMLVKLARNRADQFEAASERVRALHVEATSNGGPLCEHCTDWAGIAVGFPCPTLRALNGAESPGDAMT